MRTQIVPEQTGPGRERGKCGKMSSSLNDRKNIYNSSYEDDSFETAEESVLAGHRSSHFAMGRRESVFLAESSTSAEEIQESSPFGQTISEGYDESTPSIIATVSANKTGAITEEQDYSDQFESIADNFSEDGSSTKVYVSVLAFNCEARKTVDLILTGVLTNHNNVQNTQGNLKSTNNITVSVCG